MSCRDAVRRRDSRTALEFGQSRPPSTQPATGAMPANRDALRLLILNGDLPVFPGWGGIEYLHTAGLARLAKRVGLVSLLHTAEQQSKTRALTDAGVALYLWENPD